MPGSLPKRQQRNEPHDNRQEAYLLGRRRFRADSEEIRSPSEPESKLTSWRKQQTGIGLTPTKRRELQILHNKLRMLISERQRALLLPPKLLPKIGQIGQRTQ